MRRLALLTAAVLAAVFLWLVTTLPPLPVPADGSVDEEVKRRTVAGAFHVHTTRSDGSEDIGPIAAAAASAGLRFVVLTDHGDAMRAPDPPAYRDGVLLIDAVEISSNGGHYVALDMPAAPYPLGGEPAAVVEDVRRLGGFGVAAHPDSPKSELQWKDWTAGVDGIEWLNLDSEWRDESRARLARVVFDYPFRKAPALAWLLDRPVRTLERWDALRGLATMVALAGHDAHGGALEGAAGGLAILPSYEASFRTFSVRALLRAAPSGDAARDARLLLDAVRAGRLFSAIDAVATPAYVDFRLSREGRVWTMGESAVTDGGGTFNVRATLPAAGRMVLLRDGQELAQSTTGSLDAAMKGVGAYRVEIRVEGAPGTPPVPWVVTNPIYVRGPLSQPPAVERSYSIAAAVTQAGGVEKDNRSSATVVADGGGTGRYILEYALAPDDRTSQYVALAIPVPEGAGTFDSVSFDGRSAAPMRLSVQLRFNSPGGARWIHSVYLSPDQRRIVVPLDRLLPAEPAASRPDFTSASSVLFVVDLTNARPGQSGRFEISNLALTAR
jgi:hypothetical protein